MLAGIKADREAARNHQLRLDLWRIRGAAARDVNAVRAPPAAAHSCDAKAAWLFGYDAANARAKYPIKPVATITAARASLKTGSKQ
jgi:hypothetical protein